MEQSPPENPFQSPAEDSPGSGGYGARLRGRQNNESNLESIDWILAGLYSGIACIIGIFWLIQGKPKGLKMIGVSLMFVLLWNVVRVVLPRVLSSL
jgi:hypothetical protein